MFGRLKDYRRVATRYDQCPETFLSAIMLTATVFGLIPSSRLNVVSEACDRCIAALTACVVVALP